MVYQVLITTTIVAVEKSRRPDETLAVSSLGAGVASTVAKFATREAAEKACRIINERVNERLDYEAFLLFRAETDTKDLIPED